jgi:adenine-specific DNA-methyltransferase
MGGGGLLMGWHGLLATWFTVDPNVQSRLPMPDQIGNRHKLLPLAPPVRRQPWRPIHYIGSKLRLTDTIRDLLNQLDRSQGPACDLFAGSGTVSLAISDDREVVAADIQEYSRVLCTALLRPVPISDCDVAEFQRTASARAKRLEDCLYPILEFERRAFDLADTNPALLCDLSEQGSLIAGQPINKALDKAVRATRELVGRSNSPLMTTRYFGGSYFSFRQALQIDALLESMREPRETFLSALLSTASTIVNSVGKQFAQPMRPRHKDGSIKSHLIQQMLRDRTKDAMEAFSGWLSRYRELSHGRIHRVIRADYREVLAELTDISVIYADPPYTRDHYSRFYHVLETLCLRDSPEISTTLLTGEGTASRGMYRTDRHQSPFCIKSQAPGAFTDLFMGAQKLGVPLLISYSPFVKDGHPRLMTVEAIAELGKRHYRKVEIFAAGTLVHSKLNHTSLHREASREAEVFLLCRD